MPGKRLTALPLSSYFRTGFSENTVTDNTVLQAAVCFVILRYTAKETIELPSWEKDRLLLKSWCINDSTTMVELAVPDRIEDWQSPEEGLVDELSLWNPLYVECQSEEDLESKLGQAAEQGIHPDIIFCKIPDPNPQYAVYSSRQFHNEGHLEQIHRHWMYGIQLLETRAKMPAKTLCILTPEEYEEIIFTWNANEKPAIEGKFDFELFDKRVEESPDKIAVFAEGETLTYKELQQQANQLAHYLQRSGVGPEVVVGIYLTRSIEFVVSMVALKKSGGAFLPLDPDHPKERKEFFITNSRVPYIITTREWVDSLPAGEYKSIVLDDIAEELKGLPTTSPRHGLKNGSMSYLFYTSGSTGQPKGVMMKIQYSRKRKEQDENPDPNKTEKVLLKSSTGFTLILIEVFSPLQSGGQIVVVPKDMDKDPHWLITTIQSEQVENLNLVPSMLALLLLQDDIRKCTSIKKVITVGERLPVSVQRDFFEKLPQAKLFVYYGCTEAPAATFREILPTEDYGERVVLGKPMANKKVYLLDKFGVPVPIGVPGEIFVGGTISRGYIHNVEMTDERFLPNPFTGKEGDRVYQTGDLGRYLPDGSIEYLGRTDFQVQIRGIRIELGEIESTLSSHRSISDAVVLARKSQTGQNLLIAYYKIKNDESVSDAELRTHVRASLPDYMTPARFIQMDEFPTNTSGKIDRMNFPDPDSMPHRVDGEEVLQYLSKIEFDIRYIFFQTLGISQILKTESFFDTGGDSLLAVNAINRINKKFGVKIGLPQLYENPTIEKLAKLITGRGYKSDFDLTIKIRTNVGNRNLFLICGREAAEPWISKDFDIYLMRSVWYNETFDFSEHFSDLVDKYVAEIVTVQPRGPYHLVGVSLGGLIAHQAACHLQNQGEEIESLYLADPSPPVEIRKNRKIKNNFLALAGYVYFQRLKRGPGIIYSLTRNWLGLRTLTTHRPTIGLMYANVLAQNANYKTFSGDAHLFHRIDYGEDKLSSWKSIITGEISTQELPMREHMEIERNPTLRLWCEQIKVPD